MGSGILVYGRLPSCMLTFSQSSVGVSVKHRGKYLAGWLPGRSWRSDFCDVWRDWIQPEKQRANLIVQHMPALHELISESWTSLAMWPEKQCNWKASVLWAWLCWERCKSVTGTWVIIPSQCVSPVSLYIQKTLGFVTMSKHDPLSNRSVIIYKGSIKRRISSQLIERDSKNSTPSSFPVLSYKAFSKTCSGVPRNWKSEIVYRRWYIAQRNCWCWPLVTCLSICRRD